MYPFVGSNFVGPILLRDKGPVKTILINHKGTLMIRGFGDSVQLGEALGHSSISLTVLQRYLFINTWGSL